MAIKRKSTGPVPGQPKAKAVKSNGKEFNGKKNTAAKAQKVRKESLVQDEEESEEDDFEGFGDDDGTNESDVSMEDDEDDLDMSDEEGEDEEDEEEDDDEEKVPKPKKKSDKPPKSDDEPSGHIAQRALAKERKMSRPNGIHHLSAQLIKADKLHEAKTLWESLRLSKQSKAERQAQVDELFNIITGDIPSLVFGHSASRFVQTAVKYGSPAQRTAIAEELKGQYIELAKSKYGKFLVVKILEYGNEDVRNLVMSEFAGNIGRLITHAEAGMIVNDMYRDICTPAQKLDFLQELYGPEYRLFKREKGQTLEQIIDGKPLKKEQISKNLGEMVKNCMKKNIVNLDLVHTALLQALQISIPHQIEEFVGLFKDQIQQLVHTKDGAHAACLLIAHATAKDRKTMVKSLKEIILQMSTDQHAHTVLLTLLAVVDDTKLVSKAIQSELQGQWSDVIWHKWGRRVVLFLCREDKDPLIKEVREKSAGTSKKDVAVRREELLEAFGSELLGVVEAEADGMMRDPQTSQVVQEILLFTKENGDAKSRAVDAVVSLGSGDPSDEKHIIRVPFTARIYKTLVQGGHYNPKEKTVEVVDPEFKFASKLSHAIPPHISQWATGDGSFVVVALLEVLSSEEKDGLRKDLKSHGKAIKEKAGSNKGSKLILEKIA